jgi:YcaO-like protein with predicted kinase domain
LKQQIYSRLNQYGYLPNWYTSTFVRLICRARIAFLLGVLVLLLETADPHAQELLSKAKSAGVAVAIWDATSDLAVPTFICRMVDVIAKEHRPYHAVEGSGCHLHRDIALIRAITEAAQIRLTMIDGARDDLFEKNYRDRIREFDYVRQETLEAKKKRQFDSAPSFESDDFRVDLRYLLDCFNRRNISDVLAVDLSRPEIKFAAVRVLVPALEDGEDATDYRPRKRALAAYWGGRTEIHA